MSFTIDIISRIHEVYPQLKDAEKKVAHCIVDHLEFAAIASISELAQKAQVSEASVTRFSKALGCKNLRELKMNVARSLAAGQRFIIDEKPDENGLSGIYASVHRAVEQNAQALNMSQLEAVCQKLDQARQVIILGMGGSSTIMAQELQFRLFRLGIAATAYNDGLLCRMVASVIEKRDVLVALSVSGFNQDVLDAAHIAQQYGASVVAITAPHSALAQLSDLHLPIISQEEEVIYKPSASRYAILLAIDALAYQLAIARKPHSKDKLRRIKLALDSYRQGGDRLPLGD